MQKYFIRHKLQIGDTAFLSDSDSEIAISKNLLHIEDPIQIETLEKVFLGKVVNILPASIEIQIFEELGDRGIDYRPSITVIQSLSNESKFNFFLEKSVEIGIDRVIPVESKYSLKTANKAVRDIGFWRKLVNDASEQSRNPMPTVIERPIKISKLKDINFKDYTKICLATEAVKSMNMHDFLKSCNINSPFVIAVGPEKGWSSSDLDIFRDLDFNFVSLRGNILRTETAGLVISSILKYLKGEI
jgi:16S rRNA (uracil1498-N3)-methyltransferase